MKKIIYSIFIFVFAWIISISSIDAKEFTGVIEKGEAIPDVYYYKHRDDTDTIKYPTHNFHEQAYIYRNSLNHNIVYCIESWSHITGATSGDYYEYDTNVDQTNLTNEQLDMINLIAYYGYGYKDSEYDHTAPYWYAVTQMLIWRIQAPNYQHFFVNSATSTTPIADYEPKISEISELLTKHNKKFMLRNQLFLTINSNETFSNYYNDDYEIINNNSEISVEKVNGNVNVKSLNSAGSYEIKLVKNYKRWNKKMKLYISDNFQNVLEPGDPESKVKTSNVNVKGNRLYAHYYSRLYTKADNNNTEYSTYIFNNIKAQIIVLEDIYDGAGNKIYQKGDIYKELTITDNYINIPIIPGKFEIKQITSILGYSNKNAEIEIKPNKDLHKAIKLNPSIYRIHLTKTSEILNDNGEISKIPGINIRFGLYAYEDIYNLLGTLYAEKDTLMDILVTDEDGKIDIEEKKLIPGKYYIQELDEFDDYKKNDKKYILEYTYPQEYQEYVDSKQINITNKLREGIISIIKCDSMTGESLKGVRFALYSKDKTLLEEKTTDDLGTIEFKVKVGEYYIKEIQTLEDYIIDNKVYYVKVDRYNLNHDYKINNEKIYHEDKLDKDEPEKDKLPEKNESKEELKEEKLPEKDEQEKNTNNVEEKMEKQENELIVSVPRTDNNNRDILLLLLLSLTLISIPQCLKIFVL